MAVIKDHKRNLDEEQGGTTSKKMKPNYTVTKDVNDAQLPTPQTSPSLPPEQSQVTKEHDQNNSPSITQKTTENQTPIITTKHSELYHDPELLPLDILLQQSIDVSKAARGGPPMISKAQTETPQSHTNTTLLPDIWTLITETKTSVPAQMFLSSSSTAPHPDNEKLCANFAPTQSKKKRTAKWKISKVQILLSAAEKAKGKRTTSESLVPAEWKQRLEYLEARLIRKGYDKEKAGIYAVIMRLLCISLGELEGKQSEPEILEEVPERLDVEETQA